MPEDMLREALNVLGNALEAAQEHIATEGVSLKSVRDLLLANGNVLTLTGVRQLRRSLCAMAG